MVGGADKSGGPRCSGIPTGGILGAPLPKLSGSAECGSKPGGAPGMIPFIEGGGGERR